MHYKLLKEGKQKIQAVILDSSGEAYKKIEIDEQVEGLNVAGISLYSGDIKIQVPGDRLLKAFSYPTVGNMFTKSPSYLEIKRDNESGTPIIKT